MMSFINKVLYFILFKVQSKSKKGHNVHSPFVYKLIENVFNNKNEVAIFDFIEEIRVILLKNNKLINLNGFGSGSKTFNNKGQISVSVVTKHTSVPKKYGQFLFNFVQHTKPQCVIELGSSVGISSMYLSSHNFLKRFITIEGEFDLCEITAKNLEYINAPNFEIVHGNFFEKLPFALSKCGGLKKLVFVDGDHSCEKTLAIFNQLIPNMAKNDVVIFDDIYLNKGMIKAWEMIKNDKRVMLTIDIYKFGIVFFDDFMPKQNFKINF
jgi:predicted O-methyltransferase YrrM